MRFLAPLLLAGVTALTATPALACVPWAPRPVETGASKAFPQGTAVSGVRGDRAVVWTRPARAASLRVRASAGPDCVDVLSRPSRSRGGRDGTARIEISGLSPGTWYRYRVETTARRPTVSPWAWFRTAPVNGGAFSLVFTADIGPREKWRRYVMDQLAAEDADLLLFLGDWLYADVPPKARTARDFRRKYRDAGAVPEVRRLLATRAIEAVWDDHEVKNDWDAQDAEKEPERIDAGMRAWQDNFLTQGAPRGEVFRRFHWGPDVEVFVLDTRSHRSANRAEDSPRKTMLGKQQLRWLLAGLSASTATFKLVCSSVPLDYGTTRKDQWPAFSLERDKILSHIDSDEIDGVVFLTADQHWFAAHHLPGGTKQFQAGPLSQFLRTPRPGAPPAVRVQAPELNYAIVRFDPSPPRLTVIGKATGGKELYREVLSAGRGRLNVVPPHPFALWQTEGAHTFFGTGPLTARSAPAGEYALRFAASPDIPVPPVTTFKLPPGGSHQARWSPGAAPRVWERFDGSLADWTVVDQGVADSASTWMVEEGALHERGNCFDVEGKRLSLPKNGTMLLRDGATLNQGTLVVRAAAFDNDGFGLVYHYLDPANYHRVAFHPEREFVRIVRVRDGVATVLARLDTPDVPRMWWSTFAVRRDGDNHDVYMSGQRVLTATDRVQGGITGLYSWAMKDVRFDDFAIFDRR